jgi:predicted NAD/FAD-binding protein
MMSEDDQPVALTYNMNILQGHLAPVQFCVTLNNSSHIDKRKIISRMEYEHPIYTPESILAQQRQEEINGVKRSFYCGAYWRNGFHEDGVVSALNALDHFNTCRHKLEEVTDEKLYLRRAG